MVCRRRSDYLFNLAVCKQLYGFFDSLRDNRWSIRSFRFLADKWKTVYNGSDEFFSIYQKPKNLFMEEKQRFMIYDL